MTVVLERYGVCDDTVMTLDISTYPDVGVSDVVDISDALRKNCHLTFINLSNITFTVESAEALGRVFCRDSKCVAEYLKLQNCHITPAIIHAFLAPMESVGAISRLEILDISNNPLGDEGAALLAQFLEKHNIGKISNPYDGPGTTILNQTGSLIRTLELASCKIGLHGAAALGAMLGSPLNCRLTTINLEGNKLHFAGVSELCKGLVNNKTLRVLNISDNTINYDGGLAIAQMFRENKTLETLQVRNNYLSDSMPFIADSLSCRGTCARLLDFSINRISADTCCKMAQVLESSLFYVSCLSLEGNHIGDEGLMALYHAIKGTSIQFLDISETNLTSSSMQVLADLIRFCPILASLQIDGNNLGDEALAAIAKEIATSKIKSINVERCGLGPIAVGCLASSIAKHHKLRSLTLADNKNVNILPILDALCTCRTLEYLDMSDMGLVVNEDYLRAMVGVFISNSKLQEINLEHNVLPKEFDGAGVMTRQLAMNLAADASQFEHQSDVNINTPHTIIGKSGVGSGALIMRDGSYSFDSVTINQFLRKVFHPKWATKTPMEHGCLLFDDEEGSDGEDGGDIPLLPHQNSLHHSMYPGFGNSRFSSSCHIQTLSNPVPYNVSISLGTKSLLQIPGDNGSELSLPIRRPLSRNPYSLIALESNKCQLPITEDHLRKKFIELDLNGNGYLDRAEFKNMYLAYQFFGLAPTENDVDEIMKKNKMWADDKISFDEFCVLMLKLAQL